LGQNTHEMLARPRRSLLRCGAASIALAVSLLGAPYAHAQEPTAVAANDFSPATARTTATPSPGDPGVSSFTDSLIPGFTWSGSVNIGETYSTNAIGVSTGGQSDWLTQAGIGLGLHEHSRRTSLDASYSGQFLYSARDTQSAQFTNYLQAVANVIVIPDYVNFMGSAFAQPVALSNTGIVTANGTVSPNGYSDSYGFSAGPDITFALGNFARSQTDATYSAAYFTDPNGAAPGSLIPGVPGPQNTTMRTFSQRLTSGPDFSRLSWSLVGVFSEMDRPQGVFSEKAGVGSFQYAITREIALLATGGYDAISNTTPLTKDISGPVAMGGFALTLGDDFSLSAQAGQKYNDLSVIGNLLWNIGPTTAITGSLTDSVTTPEGQLLNNLTSLTASLNGTLASRSGIYANGSTSSLGAFTVQPQGSQAFSQTIARYQQINLGFAQDFEREHFNISALATRLTQLNGFFLGPPVTNSWSAQAMYAHDFSRDFRGSIGAGYSNYEELGGNAGTYNVSGGLTYSLSPATGVYFRADFYTRASSASLQALSPYTGSLNDLRLSIGLNHTL
jgi:uncharacterized protein (PEP-CTERM system associated)